MVDDSLGSKCKENRLIFIGGYSRTGTTLMQGILCADSQAIAVTRECSYLRGLMEAYELARQHWTIHTHDYFDSFQQFQTFHRQLLSQYFEHVCARFGISKAVVQKEPTLTHHFGHLAQLFDAARFIVMVRDPRDVIASEFGRNKGSAAAAGRNASRLLENYIRRYESTVRFRPDLEGRTAFIRYEEFVTSPATVMPVLRRLTGLGLNFDPTKDRWPSKRRPDEESASPLDGRPVSASSIGNFRSVLTDDEIILIDDARDRIREVLGLDPYFDHAVVAGGN